MFPFLFALAISKEVRVKDVWNPSVVWSPSFSRHFNNWEVDYVERFLLSLRRVCRDEEDMALWTETKSDKFTVKSLYNALDPGS